LNPTALSRLKANCTVSSGLTTISARHNRPKAGTKKVGYTEVHTGNMAINSGTRDRSLCLQIGNCFQGCKSGAKWSTLVAELPRGEETGNLEVRHEYIADQMSKNNI
jgi:hypothetical protein